MWTPKPFRRELVAGKLCLLIMLIMASPGDSIQTAEAKYAVTLTSPPRAATFTTRDPAAPRKIKKSPPLDRLPLFSKPKLAAEQITSFFIRANDSKRIQLSVLITHQKEFTQAVRQLLQEQVTPLVLSVSTLPNRTVNFNPALLRFEQRGRLWQPNAQNNATDIWPLEAGDQFGGMINESQVHQGVILLPGWFDPHAPITVRYGDFHYLARFVK